MSTFQPQEIREKTFDVKTRGYDRVEVSAYLARVSVAVEVIGEAGGQVVSMPDELTPDAMRAREFRTIWRGYDPRQVTSFLYQVAQQIESA